ncbi:MAG: 4Fe-4S dicluster domain-containing protein [Clostridia bacterium]|nr:4Fe-4S dicluster domain-containing protein [Clostridia bacterium]
MSVIQLKEANCKNCYKCIRSCPIKSIAFKDEQAKIIDEDCVLCGNCLSVCPQNAKSIKSDLDKVKAYIKQKEKVYVSLAPSFIAAFDQTTTNSLFNSLKQLGFSVIEETTLGAVEVSKEYDKLITRNEMKNIISSCCPTVTALIEKYYPEILEQLAPVVSPMIVHAKMIKKSHGANTKVVFIGPCISKKTECNDLQNDGVVDAVITFEELSFWMKDEEIESDTLNINEITNMSNPAARFYPAPGGIIKTLSPEKGNSYKCISIDGLNRCIDTLESIKNGNINHYFIEMNSCIGGCLGGPGIKSKTRYFLESNDLLSEYALKGLENNKNSNPPGIKTDMSLLKKFMNKSKVSHVPNEETIRGILKKIGKFNEQQELNCGACGYFTCREKAIAVYNHKADLHMCLPYMRERAESISNIIISSTPNAILALNQELYIQEFNSAAEKLFGIEAGLVQGKSIYDILDCTDFEYVKKSGRNIMDKKVYYEAYGITVMQSILLEQEHNMIILLIRDITSEEKQKQNIYKVRSDTVEIAQNVINKQMRVAQEIASLLGETTAETKVALTKLKHSMLEDMGEDTK